MYKKPICEPQCPERRAGCHATCERYKEWRYQLLQDKDREIAGKNKERRLDQVLYGRR